MADENKPKAVPIADAKTINDWVAGYYGTDTFDYGKKDKIKHVGHVAQFASICYVISKNSKKAHVDLFESNYTASSGTVDKAATLIVKLLDLQTGDGGNYVITQEKFQKLAEGLGFKPEFAKSAEVFNDYMDLTKTCQTLFPVYTDASKNAALMKDIIGDLDEVIKDHSQLRAMTNGNEVAMKLEDILGMRYKITELGSSKWNAYKSEKSGGEFKLSDAKEAFREDERDLAFKTGKVVMLGGTAAMSVGAVIGGAFWPALLLIPVYALGKKWVPEFFKSLGKTWGGLENQRKLKRQIDRASAKLEFLQLWATYGKKDEVYKHLSPKSKWLLRGIDITCFQKQGKQMQEAVSTEIFETDANGDIVYNSNGKPVMKFQKSKTEERFDALTKGLSVLQNPMEVDNLAPADVLPMLKNKLETLEKKPNESTFDEFLNIAQMYKNYESKIPGDKLHFQQKYGETLKKCAEHLIFETPMESLTRFNDDIKNRFGDESPLLEVCKVTSVETIEQIKRWTALASKELTGIEEVAPDGSSKWQGKTLKEYIFRDAASKLTKDDVKEGLIIGSDSYLNKAIEYIANLEIKIGDERDGFRPHFVSKCDGDTKYVTLDEITETIGRISDVDAINLCNQKLNKQMSIVSVNKSRQDSQTTYKSVIGDSFSGKPAVSNLSELFKKISEITYENVGSATTSEVYNDISTVKIPGVRDYLHGKLGKAVYDVFNNYATANENTSKFKTDLKELATFLKNINASTYLDEQQKQKLSLLVKPYISDALNKTSMSISNDFSTYNGSDWDGFIENPYDSIGFKTLFDSDKSDEVQSMKRKMEFMSSLKGVKESLKFGKFGIDAIDRDIISKILLRNNKGNFDETITRSDNDVLLNFLKGGIRPTKLNETLDMNSMDNENVYNRSCYGEIEGKLAQIVGKQVKRTRGKIEKDSFDNVKYENLSEYTFETTDVNDRYAALIALKTEFCREFEEFFVANILKQSEGYSVSNWLSTVPDASKYWENIVKAWKPLAEEIDKEMAEILPKVTLRTKETKSLADFLRTYNIKDSSKVKETTRVQERD